jgi:hypothetical protein
VLLLRIDAVASRESATLFNSAPGACVDEHAQMSGAVSIDESLADVKNERRELRNVYVGECKELRNFYVVLHTLRARVG